MFVPFSSFLLFAATSLGSIKLNQLSDKMKYYLNSGLEKLTDTLSIPTMDRQQSTSIGVSKIVFVLPLAGRYETLLRFLNNYEDVSSVCCSCTVYGGFRGFLDNDDNPLIHKKGRESRITSRVSYRFDEPE
jgi:Chondroitin N-acetylgalactosaminyltransferase